MLILCILGYIVIGLLIAVFIGYCVRDENTADNLAMSSFLLWPALGPVLFLIVIGRLASVVGRKIREELESK